MNAKQQTGFTLIEMVGVIAILGILSAVAVPRFVDLRQDALNAATTSLAGAVSSAFATNYSYYADGQAIAIAGTKVTVLDAVNSIMIGGFPSAYSITPATVACGAQGQTATVAIGATITNVVGLPSAQITSSAIATLICTG